MWQIELLDSYPNASRNILCVLKLSLCADQLGLIILLTAQTFAFSRTHKIM